MPGTIYVISYANYSIKDWAKLQMEIVLSATESEYIALSQSLSDALPLTELLKEIREIIPSATSDGTLRNIWEQKMLHKSRWIFKNEI